MEIILLTEINKLGGVGDIVKTRDGYARNYLIPYGYAKPATPENCAEVERRRQELEAAVNKERAEAKARHAKLDGLAITLEVETKDGTELYGSIGVAEVTKCINDENVGEVQKSEVILNDGAIRKVGDHAVVVALHADLTAEIALKVISKGGEVNAAENVEGESAEDAEEASESQVGEEAAPAPESQVDEEAAPESPVDEQEAEPQATKE